VYLAVNSFKDISEIKWMEQSQRLLAEAGNVLSTSLDYTKTLANVANLAVPQFADWCTVHISGDNGDIQSLVATHSDPEKLKIQKELEDRYPFTANEQTGISGVLRTG